MQFPVGKSVMSIGLRKTGLCAHEQYQVIKRLCQSKGLSLGIWLKICSDRPLLFYLQSSGFPQSTVSQPAIITLQLLLASGTCLGRSLARFRLTQALALSLQPKVAIAKTSIALFMNNTQIQKLARKPSCSLGLSNSQLTLSSCCSLWRMGLFASPKEKSLHH